MNTPSWQKVIDILSAELPAKAVETWFAPLVPQSLVDDMLRLSVPSRFVAEYIQSHYSADFARAIATAYGDGVRYEYLVVDPNEQKSAAMPAADAEKGDKAAQEPAAWDSRLNPRYTFETFILGAANKLARSVAASIAKAPGKPAFNPFFLYGPSGVGKTHLANAIGVKISELHPEKRVLFVSAHEFRTQFVEANLKNTTNSFYHFYQTIDVLIIDDVQEITTPRTQLGFFQIFNHLQGLGRQIVLTCDRKPEQVPGIEERMLTRFKWGIVAEIERPDIKLRRDILTSKTKRDGLDIPRNVIQYIATHVESSVRELEGIVNQLMAYSISDDCEIDLDLAERIVSRAVNIEQQKISADDILKHTCRHFGVKPREVQGKGRSAALTQPRHVAIYLIHKYTGESYATIGQKFSKRDHSTILHSCNTIAQRLSADRDFRHEVEEIERGLKA